MPKHKNLGNDGFWPQKMTRVTLLESVLYSEDWPQWADGRKVADFDGTFGQLNLEIEKWSI